MINTVPATSQARKPRGIVKLNGLRISGWFSFTVNNNSYYQSDTFQVSFAATALPPDRNVDWFSQQLEMTVEILAGFPVDAEAFTEKELQSLIYGKVDSIEYDPVSTIIEISGRDLTSVLIDEKTTEKWPNLTSSQIAKKIAEKHGLTPVITATKTRAGKYYEIDHARLTDERSEWDLLTYLAHEEQFSVYVQGQELHFEPQAQPDDDPYVLRWYPPTVDNASPVFNGENVSFSRNLTIARGVTVTVRSWNLKNKKAFQTTYPTAKARGTTPGGSAPIAQVYSYTIPNLTPEQALQRAQALHREITQHEIKMNARLPADTLLTPRKIIRFEGTGTSFDQIYFPESITRSMSVDEGYSMAVSAKNHSPVNEVVI